MDATGSNLVTVLQVPFITLAVYDASVLKAFWSSWLSSVLLADGGVWF